MAELHYQKFKINAVILLGGQYVEANCAEIAFINIGTATMDVNGIQLLPNVGFNVSANDGELDQTTYNIKFTGAGTQICQVVRKIYTANQ